jgi:hypothetical protein
MCIAPPHRRLPQKQEWIASAGFPKFDVRWDDPDWAAPFGGLGKLNGPPCPRARPSDFALG